MKRKPTTPAVEQTRAVRLNDAQLLSKSKALAQVLTRRKALRHELNSKTKAIKADVAVCDAQIEQLRQEIEQGFEERPQGDLFAQDFVQPDDGKVPGAQAAAALQKIGKEAGVPSEPHEFTPSKAKASECSICGAGAGDPVHAGGVHVFVPPAEAPKEGPPLCEFTIDGSGRTCGKAEGFDVHDLAGARPEPVVAPKAEDAAPARPCPACKRGTCVAHAHRFEGGDSAMLCSRCKKARKAKIHKEPEDGWPAPAAAETLDTSKESTTTSGNGTGGETPVPVGAKSRTKPKPTGPLARKAKATPAKGARPRRGFIH